MSTGQRRSALSYIPGYANNAVIQLIIFSGILSVMLGITWSVMTIIGYGQLAYNQHILANIGLSNPATYGPKLWTILTYGLFHAHFWELVSNMLWLYCFGSLVQMLVGHKQVIPIYIYSLIAGGIFYKIAQLIPGISISPDFIIGARAGLTGLAVAAFTLSPKYRFYLTPTFAIPIAVVVGIFIVLMVFSSGFYLPGILLLLGGGLTGFAYIKFLKTGYRPGEWAYTFYARLERTVTPDPDAEWKKHNKRRNEMLRKFEAQQQASQKRIDDILDKINQKGYNALTKEEKDALAQASKE